MKRQRSSLPLGWAFFLLLVLVVAAGLRFWQLGTWPPGLYRDEAYNGLDALGVLDGRHALFFPTNNGREPVYIYLTAVAIALLGRTALAVRLAAAVVGTLTTLATYQLAASWFGRRVGLLAAFLWATTLWPVHLSHVGFRAILLPPLLALTFWLGTLAYRRRDKWLWLAAGLVYGLAFYTYLAVRLTPLLLAALAAYLLLRRPLTAYRSLITNYTLFALGTAVSLLPFALLIWQQPDILLGRAGQVSILNPAVNGGDLWGALLRQTGAALGMFLWQGDTILRHNPAGRPVFDALMAIPFLLGVVWCIWQWRRPAAALLLLWGGIMLAPTILAEDTPHFLRAVGVLPAVVIFPALGLDWVWRGLAARLRGRWQRWVPGALVGLLLVGSTAVTIRDYAAYSQDADTGYLFEQAARQMGERMSSAQSGLNAVYFVDERFWSGWPSISFLATHARIQTFTPAGGLPPLPLLADVFIWPYTPRDYLPPALPPQAVVWVNNGPLARGDLEPEAYPLYVHYGITPPFSAAAVTLVSFGDALQLHWAEATAITGGLQIDLVWSAATLPMPADLTAFVHIVDANGLIAQDDAPPGSGNWAAAWWRPGLLLHERRIIPLPQPFDTAQQQVLLGVYDAALNRLPAYAAAGAPLGDVWIVKMGE